VYDVGYSDNVVLYREHLHDDDDGDGETIDDGISLRPYDYEGVPEMAGIHEADEAPSATSTELNGTQYHSNVHLGELTLGQDPNEHDREISLSVEVDYTDGVGSAFDEESELRALMDRTARTYALYGIDLEYTIDREIQESNIDNLDWYPIGESGDFRDDLVTMADLYRDRDRDLYLAVIPDGTRKPKNGGANDCLGRTAEPDLDGVVMLCTERHRQQRVTLPSAVDNKFDQGEIRRVLATKTLVHEVGHVLEIGELDDRNWKSSTIGEDEVYSGFSGGNGRDYTPENTRIENRGRSEWSIMSSGFTESMLMKPMNGSYFCIQY